MLRPSRRKVSGEDRDRGKEVQTPPSDAATGRKPRGQKVGVALNLSCAQVMLDCNFWFVLDIFFKSFTEHNARSGAVSDRTAASSIKEATRNSGLSPDATAREVRHTKALSLPRYTLCVHISPFQTGSNNG